MNTVPFHGKKKERRGNFSPTVYIFFPLSFDKKATDVFLAPFPREETKLKAGEGGISCGGAAWWLAHRHRRQLHAVGGERSSRARPPARTPWFKAWRWRSVSCELLLLEKRGGHGASKASDAGYGSQKKRGRVVYVWMM